MSDHLPPVPYVAAWEERTYRLFLIMPAGVGPVAFQRVMAHGHAGCALVPYLQRGLPLEDVLFAGQWETEGALHGGFKTLVSEKNSPRAPGGSCYGFGIPRSGEADSEVLLWGLFARTVGGDRKQWKLEPGVVKVRLMPLRQQLKQAAEKKFLALGMMMGTRMSDAGAPAARVGQMGLGIRMPSAKQALSSAAEVAGHAAFYAPELLMDGDHDRTASIHPPLVAASAEALGLRV